MTTDKIILLTEKKAQKLFEFAKEAGWENHGQVFFYLAYKAEFPLYLKHHSISLKNVLIPGFVHEDRLQRLLQDGEGEVEKIKQTIELHSSLAVQFLFGHPDILWASQKVVQLVFGKEKESLSNYEWVHLINGNKHFPSFTFHILDSIFYSFPHIKILEQDVLGQEIYFISDPITNDIFILDKYNRPVSIEDLKTALNKINELKDIKSELFNLILNHIWEIHQDLLIRPNVIIEDILGDNHFMELIDRNSHYWQWLKIFDEFDQVKSELSKNPSFYQLYDAIDLSLSIKSEEDLPLPPCLRNFNWEFKNPQELPLEQNFPFSDGYLNSVFTRILMAWKGFLKKDFSIKGNITVKSSNNNLVCTNVDLHY